MWSLDHSFPMPWLDPVLWVSIPGFWLDLELKLGIRLGSVLGKELDGGKKQHFPSQGLGLGGVGVKVTLRWGWV